MGLNHLATLWSKEFFEPLSFLYVRDKVDEASRIKYSPRPCYGFKLHKKNPGEKHSPGLVVVRFRR
jgi:hypothetical protein